MKTSESIKNLTVALLKAQTQTGSAIKGSKNPFFKSNYSDLPTIMEVVKDPLNDNGILVLQPATHRDGKNFITTVLIHGESGEWMESETEVMCAKLNDAQNFGAGQTYARRFGLQSLLFIPCEDDDGNTASGRTTNKPTYTPPAAVHHLKEGETVPAQMTATSTLTPLRTSSFSKKNKTPPVAVEQPKAITNNANFE